MIEQLPIRRAYVVNLNVSVCLDVENCPIQAAVLSDVLLPMALCDLDPDFVTPGRYKTFLYCHKLGSPSH